MRSNLLPVRLNPFGKPDITGLWGMLDDLRGPPQGRLKPVLAFAIVASISQTWRSRGNRAAVPEP